LNAALRGGAVSGIFFGPAVVLDVPCDTSPGGLFRTITPRSLYNTLGRAQVRVVVDNIDPATRGMSLLGWLYIKPARAVSAVSVSPVNKLELRGFRLGRLNATAPDWYAIVHVL
jgi:hypothetical protein